MGTMRDVRLIDANALDLRNSVATDMGGMCFIEDVEIAIEQAPTIDPESLRPAWIPVTERLPERTLPPKDVLVYHDLGCGMFVDRAWYSYDKKRWCSVLGMKLKVTHWMPLPEPPKE